MASSLLSRARIIEFSDQLRKALGHALTNDLVIHGAKLMADPRLNLGIEATLLPRRRILAGLRLYILHDLFHVSPRVKSLSLQ